ncbi:MAG TPA: hypothetical protein VIL01_04485 [Thermomicrobiales bacterium]
MQIASALRRLGESQQGSAEVAQGNYRLTAAPLSRSLGEVQFIIWEERGIGWVPILVGRTFNDQISITYCRPPASEDEAESLIRIVLAGRPLPAADDPERETARPSRRPIEQTWLGERPALLAGKQ